MAFSRVSGTVSRVFWDGKGAEVVESFKTRDGKEVSKRWAAFFEEPHGLDIGDVVEVSGGHSDQVDEWKTKEGETRHSVKRTLNKAKVEGREQPADSRGGAGDDSTPF